MNPACSVKEYEKGKLSKMKKAVTFGEIMLRLQPPSYERFLQAKSFDAVYGGGEANVAVSQASSTMAGFSPPSAGVMPVKWNHEAPSKMRSQS